MADSKFTQPDSSALAITLAGRVVTYLRRRYADLAASKGAGATATRRAKDDMEAAEKAMRNLRRRLAPRKVA
jgi:hypothetical protein